MISLAVTDTHALLWAITGQPRKLGRAARAFFEEVERGRASLYVPAITLVEIGEATRRGVVSFPRGFERWTLEMFASGRYHPAPLTVDIILRAHALHAIPERGDRLIAATAAELDCPLLTKDREIVGIAGVEVIW